MFTSSSTVIGPPQMLACSVAPSAFVGQGFILAGLDRPGLQLCSAAATGARCRCPPPADASHVRIHGYETLSDDWYVLRKYRFDYRRADGSWQQLSREAYDRGNGAVILLYSRARQSVFLTRQFRLPAFVNGHPDGMLLEAPAGLLDADSPADAIRREVEEETGFRLAAVQPVLDAYMSPGSVTERLHFFAAEVDPADRVAAGGGSAGEGEDIEVVELPFAAALEAIAERPDRRRQDHPAALPRQRARPARPLTGPAPGLDWNHVRVFLAVARAGGLGRAARTLRLSEATVGRHLAALEQALGARLLDRLPNRVALTPLGQRLLADAAGMEEHAAGLERLAMAAVAEPGLPIRVTATTAVALFLTGHLHAPARRRRPQSPGAGGDPRHVAPRPPRGRDRPAHAPAARARRPRRAPRRPRRGGAVR